MGKKYPHAHDIRDHERDLFSTMLQFYVGVVPLHTVETSFKHLMSDAILYVNNHLKRDMDLEKAKELFAIQGIFDKIEDACRKVRVPI